MIGRAPALFAFIFVPLFVRYLGPTSYGLVGVYYTLVSLVSVLDLGLSTATIREVARLDQRRDRDLARFIHALEIVYLTTAILIAGVTAAAAPWIARRWLHPGGVPVSTVTRALILIGVSIAAQWPFQVYSSAFHGLQRQMLPNVIGAVSATARPFLILGALELFGKSITVFFAAQAIVSASTTIVAAIELYRALPRSGERSWTLSPLRTVSRFAGHLSLNAVIALAVSNVDKVTISRFATLDALGYYTVAFGAATLVSIAAQPFFAAAYPRFVELIGREDGQGLRGQYHLFCEAVSVIAIPAGMAGAAFAPYVMRSYLRDADLAQKTAAVFSMLVAANALNAIATVPYALQLAFGEARLSIAEGLVSLIVAVPASIWAVRHFGAAGVAAVLLVTAAGALFVVPLAHQLLLRGETARWFRESILKPGAASALMIVPGVLLAQRLERNDLRTTIGIASGTLAVLAASMSADDVRRWLMARVFRDLGSFLRARRSRRDGDE